MDRSNIESFFLSCTLLKSLRESNVINKEEYSSLVLGFSKKYGIKKKSIFLKMVDNDK